MNNKRIKILFAGDCFLKDAKLNTIIDKEIVNILQAHDIRICNLEAPINPGIECKIKKAGPHLAQSEHSVELLKKTGFNVFNLANNHILDYGDKGLASTISKLKDVMFIGAGFSWAEAYELKTINIKNKIIGFLSYTEGEFQTILFNDKKCSGQVASISNDECFSYIAEAKKQVDYLIIQVHTGLELVDLPLPEWKSKYHTFISLGADAVIGHHPHVVQPYEIYMGKPIFYSLGNFYFEADVSDSRWNKSILVSMEVDEDEITLNVFPIVKKEIIKINYDKEFNRHLLRLNKMLNSSTYITEIDNVAEQLWEQIYYNYYRTALNSISKQNFWKDILKSLYRKITNRADMSVRNYIMLLHNITIDSHKWIAERALKRFINKS